MVAVWLGVGKKTITLITLWVWVSFFLGPNLSGSIGTDGRWGLLPHNRMPDFALGLGNPAGCVGVGLGCKWTRGGEQIGEDVLIIYMYTIF